MSDNSRDTAHDALRKARLLAEYRISRLKTGGQKQSLYMGLEARCKSVENYFREEAKLSIDSLNTLARLDALQERIEAFDGGDDSSLRQELGLLQAERQLLCDQRLALDARLNDELAAMGTAQKLLQIRLNAL